MLSERCFCLEDDTQSPSVIYSGIRVKMVPYCSRSHQILYTDRETGVTSSCAHRDCVISPAPVHELRYIFLRERLQAMLLSADLGPHMVSYVRDSYMRHQNEITANYEDFYSGLCFKEFARTLDIFLSVIMVI